MATPYAQQRSNDPGEVTARDVGVLVARALLVSLFVISGVGKVMGFSGTISEIAARGLPAPGLGAVIAVVVEVIGGLLVLIGWRARGTALVMAIYTVAAGVLFHAYWVDAPSQRLGNFINFWKNISIAGGFLMVFGYGPGRLSIDHAWPRA